MTPRSIRWAALLAAVGPARGAEPLRVAAAGDLQAAWPDLAARFRAAGGDRVEASFGASGQLVRRLPDRRRGAGDPGEARIW